MFVRSVIVAISLCRARVISYSGGYEERKEKIMKKKSKIIINVIDNIITEYTNKINETKKIKINKKNNWRKTDIPLLLIN